MKTLKSIQQILAALLVLADLNLVKVHAEPVDPAVASTMLNAGWLPRANRFVSFDLLPRLTSEHVVVSDVRAANGVNQHNYLAYFQGRYWIMWSDGPGIEGRVGQRVKCASSLDAIHWSPPDFVTPVAANSGPDSPVYNTNSTAGLRWVSRGLWERNGDLIALASLDEAAGYFGPSLELHAFRLNTADDSWTPLGVIADDAINNFPPKLLPSGEWMMSQRTHDYATVGTRFLIGGVSGIDQWQSFPVFGSDQSLKAEEPFWWGLPNGGLMSLFRDNAKSGFLYRSFSDDMGRNWSSPVKTNFPDATSKFHGMRLSDGRYILISNPDPERRDPLVISISDDGLVFHTMAYLVGGRWVDYPHVIEAEGSLVVAFSGGKQTVEVLKIPLSELDSVHNAPSGTDVIAYYNASPSSLLSSGVATPIAEASTMSLSSAYAGSGRYARSSKYNDVYFFSNAVGSSLSEAGFLEFSLSPMEGALEITGIEFDYALTGGPGYLPNRGSWILQVRSGALWVDLAEPVQSNVQSEGIAHGGFNWSSQFSVHGLGIQSNQSVKFRIAVFDQLNVSNEWMRIDNIKVYAKADSIDRIKVTGLVKHEDHVAISAAGLETNRGKYRMRRSGDLADGFPVVVDGPRYVTGSEGWFEDADPPADKGFYIVEHLVD
jgi:hypothetical protein